MKFGLGKVKAVKQKMVSPKKYVSVVRKRRLAVSLLKNAERDVKTVTTLAGFGVGHKFNHGPTGAIVGWWAGSDLARLAQKKGIQLDFKTISEISGRPALARRVADKLGLFDDKFQHAIRTWGEKGPRMNKEERMRFVESSSRRPYRVDPSEEKSYLESLRQEHSKRGR